MKVSLLAQNVFNPRGLGEFSFFFFLHLQQKCKQSNMIFSELTLSVIGNSSFSVPLPSLQRLLVPRERRRPDAAGALSPRRPAGPGHPSPRPPDPHPEPRRGGLCRHHQHLHAPRLHRGQGLRQGVGHQPARKQEPHGPAGLPGET